MFIINSKNLRITTHYCHSKEVADLVYDYIKNKYPHELELKEVDGTPYFDPGGARLIDDQLTNVKLANIECRIDDLGIFVEFIENVDQDFERGFCRIGTFFGNICLSEKEFQEIKDYIKDNKEELDKLEEKANEIFDKKYPQTVRCKLQ